MRKETFYWIVNDEENNSSIRYSQVEIDKARNELQRIAIINPGKKFHLMKRVSSVVANDLTFEGSE